MGYFMIETYVIMNIVTLEAVKVKQMRPDGLVYDRDIYDYDIVTLEAV